MKGSTIVRYGVLCLTIAGGTLLRSLPAQCCATVDRSYYAPPVEAEQALIIWDARHHTEHFIRRASFEARPHDFGFLVPTPSRPQLAVADDGIFQTLSDTVTPQVNTIYEPRWAWRFGPWRGKWTFFTPIRNTFAAASNQLSASDDVEILENRKVGGYEATVLRASNATELAQWLHQHGYASRPAIKDWLQPYIQHGWILTAFKIAGSKSQQSDNVQTGTVRMSFHTPQPFFPYREPKNNRKSSGDEANPGHSLNAYFVGEKRYAGSLVGDVGRRHSAKLWTPDVPYSDELNAAQRQSLIAQSKIPSADLPASAVLTYFDDWVEQRPTTTDLFFAPSSDQHHIIPPTIAQHQTYDRVIPLDWIVLGVFVCGTGIIVWKRKRQWQ